jgi:hypothetical protein
MPTIAAVPAIAIEPTTFVTLALRPGDEIAGRIVYQQIDCALSPEVIDYGLEIGGVAKGAGAECCSSSEVELTQ